MTRKEVARYVASQDGQARTAAIQEAAAWLIESKRVRQASYLAQDIAAVLAETGQLAAIVTSARPLSASAQSHVLANLKELTGADTVLMSFETNPSLIGGVIITTPTAELDASVRTTLRNLVERTSR